MVEIYPSWTGRIRPEVKEYFQKKGFSAGQIFQKYYEILKQREIPELLQERETYINRVRQIDQIVTQLSVDCETKWQVCNTIYDEYCKTRDIMCPTQQDKFWIKCKLESNLVKEISVDEFIEHYKPKKEGETQ